MSLLVTCGDLDFVYMVFFFFVFYLDPGEALLPVLLFPTHNPLLPSLPAGRLPQGRQLVTSGGLPHSTFCSNGGTWGGSADPGAGVG